MRSEEIVEWLYRNEQYEYNKPMAKDELLGNFGGNQQARLTRSLFCVIRISGRGEVKSYFPTEDGGG